MKKRYSKSYIAGVVITCLGAAMVISSSLVNVDNPDFLLVVGKLTLVGLVLIAYGILFQNYYRILSLVIAAEVCIRGRLYRKGIVKDKSSKACLSFYNVCEDFKTVLEAVKDAVVE